MYPQIPILIIRLDITSFYVVSEYIKNKGNLTNLRCSNWNATMACDFVWIALADHNEV